MSNLKSYLECRNMWDIEHRAKKIGIPKFNVLTRKKKSKNTEFLECSANSKNDFEVKVPSAQAGVSYNF